MAEGYCFKCKAKREIAEPAEELMKNGRKAIKGKCPTCGAVMFKILGGKVAAAPAAPAPAPASTPPPAPAPVAPAPAPAASVPPAAPAPTPVSQSPTPTA